VAREVNTALQNAVGMSDRQTGRASVTLHRFLYYGVPFDDFECH